ncbi:hypothetical protein XM38_032160 [Halomicronema hongdechloris C2206]|uniref:Cofactor assembly of complex C subunit B n=1 Tax=Halomicronema hongdechloris C2206 TaxID=1641165 RepID=A0A1Z3HPN8_9CYAN|nr:cofactor assembly of complex C subunit B [Halomicronema hongdechloris]ASC72261.1 hypothetical protein XM38_032160 [Halomicronema hongdechloris C2206]
MTTPVLSSTFLLTLLLMVGLTFFIRASTKDRTERWQGFAAVSPEAILQQIREHLEHRAYRVVVEEQGQLTFRGFVRPSLFLAIFLSALAAIGALCFALVLATLFPDYKSWFIGLLLLAPAAGRFYWTRAARPEQVTLQIKAADGPEAKSQVTVTAHRDELIALRQAVPMHQWEASEP